MSRLLLALALVAGTAACGSPAQDRSAAAENAGPEVLEPRAHVLPGGMGAVYFSVQNPGGESDRLTSVETAAAAAAETHESLEEDGVMRMVAHPEGFEVPAGGTLTLEPGGKHVMLIEPRVPEGASSIAVTLRFERAGAIEVEVPLTAIGGTEHEVTDHEGTDHEGTEHEGMEH